MTVKHMLSTLSVTVKYNSTMYSTLWRRGAGLPSPVKAEPTIVSTAPCKLPCAGDMCEGPVAKRRGRPHKQYEIIKKIGQGKFGVVELVKHKLSGQVRCMKTVNKAKTQMPYKMLVQEFQNMAMIDHPHVIKLFEYYDDGTNIYFI